MNLGKDASPEGKEGPGNGINAHADEVNRRHDARQRQQKQQNNLPAVGPSQFLPFKEIHELTIHATQVNSRYSRNKTHFTNLCCFNQNKQSFAQGCGWSNGGLSARPMPCRPF